MENRIFIFKNYRPVASKRVKNCSPVYLFAESDGAFLFEGIMSKLESWWFATQHGCGLVETFQGLIIRTCPYFRYMIGKHLRNFTCRKDFVEASTIGTSEIENSKLIKVMSQ